MAVLLLFACILPVKAQTWDGTVASSYAGGDGSKDNPFLISNAAELAKLAADMVAEPDFSLGRYFRLTQDVVFNEGVCQTATATLEGGKAFRATPVIGAFASETDYVAFRGVFDGDGHVVRGIYHTFAQDITNYLALFRVVEDGEIRNLGIEDSYVYAGAYLSNLVGRATNSRIINCYVKDSRLKGWGSNSGPLCAQALGTTKIQNCYSLAVDIYGKNDMGAIVGRIGNGDVNEVIVENCYTTSTITLNNRTNRGGVTATNSEGSIVRNCYFTASAAENAVWPAQDKGTTVGCQQMTAEQMQGNDFLALLNDNSRQIAAACRWQSVVGGFPAHNYSESTPDVENQREVSMLATNPVPANGDTHADLDAMTLSWTAARDGKTVSQYIYIGTDSATIANATSSSAVASLGTETTFQLSNLQTQLSNLQTYYWRVDRVDANGLITAGDVWTFQPRHLAFPGAEGYGRFARGGRGGHVVYVTNLNSEGPGSLRWALTNGSGPRTVLFKVSGIIDLGFTQLRTDPMVTIAAQTAPGKGICIKHSDIGVGSDCIVRHLRARRGLGTPDDTGNAIGTVYSDHTIFDHVTASWGTDETFSSRGSRNVTFQRSIISEALGIAGHRNYSAGTNHGYAATIGGDIGSFHHNLLANCYGRNWSMGGGADANGHSQGRLDMFNNVVYNWGHRTTDGGAMRMQFVNNYYKMGPATDLTILFSADNETGGDRDQFAYVSGNIRENRDGSLTQDALNVTYRATGPQPDKAFYSEPFFPSFANIELAEDAYKSVLSDVGANQPFSPVDGGITAITSNDLTDQRIINETQNRSYTYTGSKSGLKGQIDDEQDAGGFEDYPETAWPADFDFDNDGLPGWWEELRGTNPRSRTLNYADTNRDTEGDGYTELERYLDFMAQPHLWLQPGTEATVSMAALFRGYTLSPSYSVDASAPSSWYGGNDKLTFSLQDGMLTIKAGADKALAELTLTVQDGAGASYSRRLCVAVTSNSSVINAIDDLVIDHSRLDNDAIYDLQGRQLSNGKLSNGQITPGLYIQNGRKFIVK
ncbi:MAG: hypothetical protein IJT98_08540 [Prevotella sp.]|nr:hypothetical protein [Prevotella sp.]